MDRITKLGKQLIKFGIVGVMSTLLDYGLMVLFTEGFGIYYLASSALSYAISLVVNYFVSMRFVFHGKGDANKIKEFFIFTVLCLCGLGLNQWILWLAVEKIGIHYMVSKLIATAIVMIWNFITRKIFLEEKAEKGSHMRE